MDLQIKAKLTEIFIRAIESEASALDVVRAVENFDRLLKAAKAARISLSGDQDFHKFKELYNTLDNAIKNAEGK